MSQNILLATIKYIFVEILLDILYFPVWWYSKGLVRVLRRVEQSAIFHIRRRVALGIWLKSMFKPMYGDTTKEGRIISIAFRILILMWKLLSVVLWFAVLFFFVVLWVLLPLAVMYYIVYQVTDISLLWWQ